MNQSASGNGGVASATATDPSRSRSSKGPLPSNGYMLRVETAAVTLSARPFVISEKEPVPLFGVQPRRAGSFDVSMLALDPVDPGDVLRVQLKLDRFEIGPDVFRIR